MTAGNAFSYTTDHRKRACVTGAAGFIGSWIVKLLLERGYTVHGTVRNLGIALIPLTFSSILIFINSEYIDRKSFDPFGADEAKNKHLRALEGASERLVLYKADLLDLDSLREAIKGCEGVFHPASPVTDDPELMVQPAVEGTRNVIRAAAEAGVRRVVFTSSVGAMTMDPKRSDDVVVDESCWSDLEFCKQTKNWYCYGKAVAEQAAWELAGELGVDLVVVNPVLVLGPLLQETVNASAVHVLKYLNGSAKTYANAVQAYVHVRDVADAHIRVYEAPTAAGRFLCAESVLHREDLVRILAKLFPQYVVPTRCSDEINPRKKPYKFSNKKLKDLGLEFIPAAQALYETVKSLQEKGQLPIIS